MKNNQRRYHSYLLRLWTAEQTSSPSNSWRVMVRDVHTGEIHNFPDLESLFLFLNGESVNHPPQSAKGLTRQQTYTD